MEGACHDIFGYAYGSIHGWVLWLETDYVIAGKENDTQVAIRPKKVYNADGLK